jgi:uncharacterized membrane protein
MSDFLDTYFLEPFRTDSGYNIINTLTYSLIAIGSLYIIYKLLQKYKIKINLKFFFALLPFIFLGSTIRAFVDNNILPYTSLTVSPGIYITTSALFFTSLAISYHLSKKHKIASYTTITASIGTLTYFLLILFKLKEIQLTNALGFFAITTLFLTSSAILYIVLKKIKWNWATTKIATLALAAHMLDASTTFIIVDFFGGWEKHPLPRYFANLAGTASTQFLLKLIIIIPALYLINKELKDKNLKNFLLIAIATLGLAEGLRNLITLIL